MVKVKMISFFNENLSKNTHIISLRIHIVHLHILTVKLSLQLTNKNLTGKVLSLKQFEREVIQHKLYIY